MFNLRVAKDWKDYEILDMANGEKLERWGNYILERPDPQIVWQDKTFKDKWKKVDAIYHRSKKGGGYWENINNVKPSWQVKYKDLTFNIKQMGFKHTGLFPEQAVNWDYMIDKIKNSNRKIKVLNLFAYTGGATVACAYAGADVVFIAVLRHKGELARYDCHHGLLRDRVRVVGDAAASRVMLCLEYVLAQFLPCHP